jgi:hypothetical protein
MAKHEGGIYSRASGKLAATVFSQARTRQGKQQTSRQLISPLNPKTPAQQHNRQVFSNSIRGAEFLDQATREALFNRTVTKLSGFNNLTSIIRNGMTYNAANFTLTTTPADIPKNGLHFPDTISFVQTFGNPLVITWSTELGSNGANNDDVHTFVIGISSYDTTGASRGNNTGSATRSTGTLSINPNGGILWGDNDGAWCIVYVTRSGTPTSKPFSLIRFSGPILTS